MDELNALKDSFTNSRPASWEALPDLALYMDQVVSYLARQKPGIDSDDNPITPAMINNYIKAGLLPRTKVKRYEREHLVYLIAISLLKNVLSVNEIKLLLDNELEPGHEREFYAKFSDIVDDAFNKRADLIDLELDEERLSTAALALAVESCASKLACQQLLSILKNRNGGNTDE